MKVWTAILSLVLFSSLSLASTDKLHSTSLQNISAYRFGACNWWNNVQTNMGMSYTCANYPQNITVPDAYDVAKALDDAEKRIAALEAKVGSLERQLEKSE